MSVYNGKDVIVTGGASFIGSHLTQALLTAGARVTVIDDLSTGRLVNLGDDVNRVNFVNQDLFTSRIDDAYRCDVLFHLANVHGGRGFIDTHQADCMKNLAIDATVTHWAAKHHAKMVFASSACVYPPGLQTLTTRIKPLYEGDAYPRVGEKGLGGMTDGYYGFAKFAGEAGMMAYREQYGLQGAACRIFTAYGPRENETHAIVAFIARAAIRQDPFTVWGDGTQMRNFTYVDDIVAGLMLAGEKISDCSAVNIGSGMAYSVNDVVQAVCEVAGYQPEIHRLIDKPVGVGARTSSLVYQQTRLGRTPTVGLRDGIKRTYDWYVANNNLDVVRETLHTRLGL